MFFKTALAPNYNEGSLKKLKLCGKCPRQLLIQVKNLDQNVES